MEDPDYNTSRNRYYGLRKGDIVKSSVLKIERGEVVNYGFMDNNKVYVKVDGEEGDRPVVAEYCEIVTKVEDK